MGIKKMGPTLLLPLASGLGPILRVKGSQMGQWRWESQDRGVRRNSRRGQQEGGNGTLGELC